VQDGFKMRDAASAGFGSVSARESDGDSCSKHGEQHGEDPSKHWVLMCPGEQSVADGVRACQGGAKEKGNDSSQETDQRGARENPTALLTDFQVFLDFGTYGTVCVFGGIGLFTALDNFHDYGLVFSFTCLVYGVSNKG
jgi:hypothetical protein